MRDIDIGRSIYRSLDYIFIFYKTKQDKELAYAHVSDSQLEKYEEILKCKDEHIKDLENRVRQLQTNVDNTNDDTTG